MAVGVAAVVAVIVAFKAAGAWRGLLLPLGVSYYSFKLISYLIEVYWDDEAVERDPVVFFLFPAFFPQIVSGPIQRPEPFFAQMRDIMARTDRRRPDRNGISVHTGRTDDEDAGRRPPRRLHRADRQIPLRLFLLGHADDGRLLHAAALSPTSPATRTSRLGIGKLFGVEGPPNFNAPFSAVNIQEFWRRWHMSLTLWLTDYLFTPLSMTLRDYGQAGLIGAIFLNMIMIGIWHGFTLNYLVFGILQAVFLSVTVLILGARTRRNRAAGKTNQVQQETWVWRRLVPFLGAAVTFALMSFSMIFFHSPTWDQAMSVLAQVSGLAPSGSIGWSGIPAYLTVPAWVCMAIALYVGAGRPAPEAVSIRQCGGPTLASIWRLPVPAYGLVHRGKWTFHLWSILTKTDLTGLEVQAVAGGLH